MLLPPEKIPVVDVAVAVRIPVQMPVSVDVCIPTVRCAPYIQINSVYLPIVILVSGIVRRHLSLQFEEIEPVRISVVVQVRSCIDGIRLFPDKHVVIVYWTLLVKVRWTLVKQDLRLIVLLPKEKISSVHLIIAVHVKSRDRDGTLPQQQISIIDNAIVIEVGTWGYAIVETS